MKELRESMMDGLKSLPAFPIVLVTVGDNIMVAAAFHFYSYNPPSVMVGIKPEKFTFQLIRDMQEFGINIPSVNQLEEVKICGSISGKDEDKYKLSNFTKQKGNYIKSALIDECAVNLECKVVHEIDYDGSHRWFIGEIKDVHMDNDYLRSDSLMFWFSQFRALGEVLEGLRDEELFK